MKNTDPDFSTPESTIVTAEAWFDEQLKEQFIKNLINAIRQGAVVQEEIGYPLLRAIALITAEKEASRLRPQDKEMLDNLRHFV